MENALIVSKPGVIKFSNYDQILADAQELATHVASVEVNEESIKNTKKLLAAVSKKVRELEDGRIAVKNELLDPYKHFEQQIKTIVNVVKEADALVRNQVRALEEKERNDKREILQGLFNRRIALYSILDIFSFDHFISNQHLNKSTSIDKVEIEMATWMTDRQKDIEFIKTLNNSDDVLVEYQKTRNLVFSIKTVQERNAAKERITPKKEIINQVTITIGRENLEPIKAFMKSLKINYTLKGE